MKRKRLCGMAALACVAGCVVGCVVCVTPGFDKPFETTFGEKAAGIDGIGAERKRTEALLKEADTQMGSFIDAMFKTEMKRPEDILKETDTAAVLRPALEIAP